MSFSYSFRASLCWAIGLFLSISLIGCGGGEGRPTDFDEVLIPVQKEKRGFWGFMRLDGEIAIEPSYPDLPSTMWQGWATVKGAGSSNRFHYIRRSGELSDQTYTSVGPFNDERAFVVNDEGSLMLLNEELEVVKTLEDIWLLRPMIEDRAAFKDASGLWGYLDTEGNAIIKPQFQYAFSFREGLAKAVVVQGEKVAQGMINSSGEWVIGPDSTFTMLGHLSEGKIAFSRGSGIGFLDTEGQVVIPPNPSWESVDRFINGYAAYQQDQVWGVIDKNGERVFSQRYSHPPRFFDGEISLQHDGRTLSSARPILVSLEGNQILTSVKSGWPLTPFIDGYGFVKGDSARRINAAGELGEEDPLNYNGVSKDFFNHLTATGFAIDPDAILTAYSSEVASQMVRVVNDNWMIGGMQPALGIEVCRWQHLGDDDVDRMIDNGYVTLKLLEEATPLGSGLSLSASFSLNREKEIRKVRFNLRLPEGKKEEVLANLIQRIAAFPDVTQTSTNSYETFDLPSGQQIRLRKRSYGNDIELRWRSGS